MEMDQDVSELLGDYYPYGGTGHPGFHAFATPQKALVRTAGGKRRHRMILGWHHIDGWGIVYVDDYGWPFLAGYHSKRRHFIRFV
jgi:hypothetical protein